MLHQFAHNAPSLFHPFVPRVLEKIWIPLRDPRTVVRERASMLLSACLEIVKSREKTSTETYRKIFDEARSGLLKANSTDTILGSLLAFGAMLQNQQIVSLETGQRKGLTRFVVDGGILSIDMRAHPEIPR